MKRRRFLPPVASLRQRVGALVVAVATLLLMFPVFVWAMAVMAVESGSVIPVGTLGEPTVTNAAELTTALRTGGVIRLAPGRYTGNFVIGVNGTTLVRRGDLPDRRVAPG